MAQLPPPDDAIVPDRAKDAREFDEARLAAARSPRLSRELLRRYEEFRGAQEEVDEASPRGRIELVGQGSRLIVRGQVATVTRQVERVIAGLRDHGWSVDDVLHDERIGVSLLAGSGLSAEDLYAAVLRLSRDLNEPLDPLAIGFDDVTYEAIVFKPVKPQGSTGEADRVAVTSERPRGTGRGAGVTVAVIDGGFEAASAPPRTDGWFDNVTAPSDGLPSLNQADPERLDPGAGHGSFVTGIIASVAPDAKIRQYRAVDSWGFGSAWRLKDMILEAVADGAQIINISLGFDDPDLLGSPAISAALHQVPAEVLVVAAAGNAGTSVPMLPAAHKVAVAIGGLNEDLIPVAWSNHGPWVDFSALAIPVISTYVVDPLDPQPNPFGLWAGTSFAAPKVAGELAVLLGEGATPSAALERLRASAAGDHPDPNFGFLLKLPDQF